MSSGKGNYDKKIFRLFYILNKIDSAKTVSTDKLAKEFNVTRRTVQRDIELLNMTGFPLVNSEGVHSFAEGFSLKKMMLSSEEASLISFLYEIAASLGDKFERSFADIFRKLISRDADAVYYAKIPDGVKIKSGDKNLCLLEKAIEKHTKVEILYAKPGRKTVHRLEPLKIVFFDGFWYLLSICERKRELVKSRVDYIKSVKPLKEYFTPSPGLKVILDESVNIWFSEKPDKKVMLKVSGVAAPYFEARCHFPRQRIKKRHKDGSIIIETKISHRMEVIPTVLAWMPHISVISPKNIRDDIKHIISEYLQ